MTILRFLHQLLASTQRDKLRESPKYLECTIIWHDDPKGT